MEDDTSNARPSHERAQAPHCSLLCDASTVITIQLTREEQEQLKQIKVSTFNFFFLGILFYEKKNIIFFCFFEGLYFMKKKHTFFWGTLFHKKKTHLIFFSFFWGTFILQKKNTFNFIRKSEFLSCSQNSLWAVVFTFHLILFTNLNSYWLLKIVFGQ